MNKHLVSFLLLSLAWTAMLPVPAMGQPWAYESYYNYLGEYPYDANPGWHEDVQGVTHDDNYWYFTHAQEDDPSDQAIWKIPVGCDLNFFIPCPGWKRLQISNVSELNQAGYWHVGDPSYYRGYLIVPVEFGCHAMACFKADNFEFKGFFQVCSIQANASWCAVDPTTGYLYSSDFDNVSKLKKYGVNWDELDAGGKLKLDYIGDMTLFNSGGSSLILFDVQGGVVSPSGEQIYITANGIHVFDMQSWRRIQRSTNGSGHFNYEFYLDEGEEPEGLTIWDLDDGRAPGIRGQLHVLMLDNDFPSADEIYFKHYTGTIYVDINGGFILGDGKPSNPFLFVTQANNLVNSAVWNGARISIKAGIYPESLTFSKRMQILATGGNVTIGTKGKVCLTTSAKINIYSGGVLKIY